MHESRDGRVAIIDYGLGNLYSVARACTHVGLNAVITSSPREVLASDAVVLPGVGAMPDAMRALDEAGLSDALRATAERGTPLFGVCLGMQLLMRTSTEFGVHDGLGLIEGTVIQLSGVHEDGSRIKVPHIGWNGLSRSPNAGLDPWLNTPLAALRDGTHMYFVHSYVVVPTSPDVVIATSKYGDRTFCSAIAADNIFATQFHPERSGPAGLEVYRAFGEMVRGTRRTISLHADV